MKSLILSISIILLATTGLTATEKMKVDNNQPTIVLTAFGTSNPEARKVFTHIDQAAKKRYPGRDIRWAYTSAFIRKKLKKQGVITKGPLEVVEELKKEGIKDVVFQSLHIAPGQEYKEIVNLDTTGLNVAVGDALLMDRDIPAVIDALESQLKTNAANVFVMHGNDKHPEFNKQLVAFANAIEKKHKNVFCCSVEGQPGTEKLEDAKKLAAKLGRVHFIPLMIVSGVHISEDVMDDDDENAWKNIISAKETTLGKPVGYNDAILRFYFEHLDKAEASLKKE